MTTSRSLPCSINRVRQALPPALLIFIILALAAGCYGQTSQTFQNQGFLEFRFFGYPQTAPGDSGRALGETFVDDQITWKPSKSFRLLGEFDAQIDSHQETLRVFHLSWQDRELQRPPFAIRRLSASYTKGKFTAELGKQYVRWGKADILNPTDHFAPRDFLNVVRSEYLAITAARVLYGTQSDTVELIFEPRFTPSRIPLANQRWVILPAGVPIADRGASFPGGTQFGARYNHSGSAAEYSFSYFDGYNNLPLINYQFGYNGPIPSLFIQRYYPRVRSYGADLAVPTHLATLKAEAAYFNSSTLGAANYLLYVLQVERQHGEWMFDGGYIGEVITRNSPVVTFDPDRGLARAFAGKASYTIDTNRSLSFEAVLRQNGKGLWAKVEYSQLFHQHWRAGIGFAGIRGSAPDFIGQFHRNSFADLILKYSF